MEAHFHRSPARDARRSASTAKRPLRTIVSRPLPRVRQNDVRLHDAVQFLEVGRGGGVAVVDPLARVRVVGPKKGAVGAVDLAGGRVRRHVEGGVVVGLGVHCWFRFLLRIWGWPPA